MKRVLSIIIIIIGTILVLGGVAPMVMGAILKTNLPATVGVIGGADGPTSIYVAGVVGTGHILVEVVVGMLMIGCGIVAYKKIRKK